MKKIRNYIKNNPAAEPDAKKLWRDIESGLLVDDLYYEINRLALEKAIQDLPGINPQKDVWQTINQHIDTNKKNIKVVNFRPVKIAASILFLIGTVLTIKVIIPEIRHHWLYTLRNQPVEIFLTSLCTRYPEKCEDPDFLEMKTEIIQLNNEKSEIENSIFFNPDDASIVRINNRINNQIINLRDQIIDYVE